MYKVGFCTLGCKVNQYETEAMGELFEKKGFAIADFNDICDIYVINTCTVTGTGDKKSRQMIRRAKKLNENAIICVVGCYSQVSPDDVKNIPGVNIVLGTKDRIKIVDMVEEYLKNNENVSKVYDIMKSRTYENISLENMSGKTRAFVKIEDGCTEFCSYCIIPYARGPVRSRAIDDIVTEVTSLSQKGFSEIVLTGIHLASYGRDLKTVTLLDAIKAVCGIDGIKRVRLGSVEPRLLTEEFIKEIANLPKVCDHFHISLQSGCDETLKRMNRKYSCDEYRNSVKILRRYYDNPSITTDIIAGFPGETEEEFNTTLEFLKEIAFAEAHIFPYSNRKGTKADVMPNQVPKHIREERARVLIDEARKCGADYLKAFIGKRVNVLFEREIEGDIYEGTTSNYMKVHVKSDADISHTYVDCVITGANDEFAIGEI